MSSSIILAPPFFLEAFFGVLALLGLCYRGWWLIFVASLVGRLVVIARVIRV